MCRIYVFLIISLIIQGFSAGYMLFGHIWYNKTKKNTILYILYFLKSIRPCRRTKMMLFLLEIMRSQKIRISNFHSFSKWLTKILGSLRLHNSNDCFEKKKCYFVFSSTAQFNCLTLFFFSISIIFRIWHLKPMLLI